MAAISYGQPRNPRKLPLLRGATLGEELHVEIPLLDGQGREHTYLNSNVFVPDGMSAQDLAAWAAAQPNGLYALFIASNPPAG